MTKRFCDICEEPMKTENLKFTTSYDLVLEDKNKRCLRLDVKLSIAIPEGFDVCAECIRTALDKQLIQIKI